MNSSNMTDQKLDACLDINTIAISNDRMVQVRRSVLVAASNQPRPSFFSFAFRPALLLATGLLGFVLGVSFSGFGDDNSSTAAYFNFQSQAFLTGDLG